MAPPRDKGVSLPLDAVRPPGGSEAALCPVDRLPARRRNKICIRVIYVGALNFLLYTLLYAVLGGDAHNGERRLERQDDGTARAVYFVRGHFIHSLEGRTRAVSRQTWIYSYVHSISVLITSGAMIISMLVLARPHILATMRDSWIGGGLFVSALGTIVVLITSAAAFVFTWDMISQLAEG